MCNSNEDVADALRLCKELWRQIQVVQNRYRRFQDVVRSNINLSRSSSTNDMLTKHYSRKRESATIAPQQEESSSSYDIFAAASLVRDKLLRIGQLQERTDWSRVFTNAHARDISLKGVVSSLRSKLHLNKLSVSDKQIEEFYEYLKASNSKHGSTIPVNSIVEFMRRSSNGIPTELAFRTKKHLSPEEIRWKRKELQLRISRKVEGKSD